MNSPHREVCFFPIVQNYPKTNYKKILHIKFIDLWAINGKQGKKKLAAISQKISNLWEIHLGKWFLWFRGLGFEFGIFYPLIYFF